MLYSWKNCLSQPGTESSLVSTADVETNGFCHGAPAMVIDL